MRNLGVLCAILSVALAAMVLVKKRPPVAVQQSVTRSVAERAPDQVPSRTVSLSRPQWIDYFRRTTHADVYNKISPDGQQILVGLAEYFCRDHFESGSCVQYAIVCGRPCLASLNRDQRVRLLQAYNDERKKAGLPPMDK